MPLYEFKCRSCAYSFEEVQGIKDPPLLFCPKCRSEVDRTFYDWKDKLDEFRRFNHHFSRAPVFPYFLSVYLLIVVVLGIAGKIVYGGFLGFISMVVFSLGVTIIGIIGSLPVIGPLVYVLWLGPLLKESMVNYLGLYPTMVSGLVYWTGFACSLLFAIITTFISLYWIFTPIMWCFLHKEVQEKMKYLLLVHFLHFNVYPVWLEPDSLKARILSFLFGITEFPAIRIRGVNYYADDIPVKPMRIIEQIVK